MALAGLASILLLATSCSSAAEPSTSLPQTSDLPVLVLTPTGLGDVPIGDDPQVVIDAITILRGGPDRDSDWTTPIGIFGLCPGTEVRGVGWGTFFTIFLNQGVDPEERRFATFTYGFDYETGDSGIDPRELNLRTEEGLGIGSAVSELRAIYGDRLAEYPDVDADVFTFTIDETGGEPYLAGRTSGPAPTDSVILIERIPGCADV